jgi:hypothetical protein
MGRVAVDQTPVHDWIYPLAYGDRLSNHDWIPLYVNRLLTSDFVAYAVAEDRRQDIGTALILWSECFKQDPAGTLPDDDVQLAQIARFGRDIEGWRQAKRGALHGWGVVQIPEADEEDPPRLGHRVIASVAFDMHKRKAGRDQARENNRLSQLRSRVRAKLLALRYPSHVSGSDQVIRAVAEFLDDSALYCSDDNVRVAMEAAVGIPRVVDIASSKGAERQGK